MAHGVMAKARMGSEVEETVPLAGMSREGDLEAGLPDQPQCRICLESDSGWDFIAPCKCRGTQKYVHRECLDKWRAVKEGFAFAHCTECKTAYRLRVNIPADRKWRQVRFRYFVTRDILLIFLAVQAVTAVLGWLVARLDSWNGRALLHYWGGTHATPFYYVAGAGLFFAGLGVFGCCYTLCGDRGSLEEPCRDVCAACCSPYGCCDCHLLPTTCLWTDCAGLAECGSCLGGVGVEGAPVLLVVAMVAIVLLAVVGVFYSVLVATVVGQRIWQRHYHVLAKRMLAKEYVVEDLEGDSSMLDLPPLDDVHTHQLKQLGLV